MNVIDDDVSTWPKIRNPTRVRFPPGTEFRERHGVNVAWHPETRLHIEITSGDAAACSRNLGGSIFEKMHPDTSLWQMHKRKAHAEANRCELSPEDKALWEEYRRINPVA